VAFLHLCKPDAHDIFLCFTAQNLNQLLRLNALHKKFITPVSQFLLQIRYINYMFVFKYPAS